MARKTRDDFPGAWHHVMNRGRNRDLIFRDDGDAVLFLDCIQHASERTGIEIHAYSLMPNHYHLLVRSPSGTLSRGMKELGREYTQRLNARHGGDGGIFRGRFRSELITNERYLMYLIGYIHLNPLKASLITRIDSELAWTSHRRYMGLDSHPEWLFTSKILERYDSPAELEKFVLNLHRKVETWPDEMDQSTGWFSKSEDSKQTLRMLTTDSGAKSEMTVARLLTEICDVTGASVSRLKESVRGPKGNPERRFAVWVMSKYGRMTQPEIGRTLAMSTVHVARDLGRSHKNITEFGKWIERWTERHPSQLSIVET